MASTKNYPQAFHKIITFIKNYQHEINRIFFTHLWQNLNRMERLVQNWISLPRYRELVFL